MYVKHKFPYHVLSEMKSICLLFLFIITQKKVVTLEKARSNHSKNHDPSRTLYLPRPVSPTPLKSQFSIGRECVFIQPRKSKLTALFSMDDQAGEMKSIRWPYFFTLINLLVATSSERQYICRIYVTQYRHDGDIWV